MQLTCSSDTGDEVEWSQSGMRVSNLNNSDIIVQTEVKNGEFVSHLTVKNIKRIQTGAYKCANIDFDKAFSSETTETDTVNVLVTSNKGKQIGSVDSLPSINYCEGIEILRFDAEI